MLIINSSLIILINLKILIPKIFAVDPKTTTTKKIIAAYTKIANFPKGINEDIPNFETVTPMSPNTPNGAIS